MKRREEAEYVQDELRGLEARWKDLGLKYHSLENFDCFVERLARFLNEK